MNLIVVTASTLLAFTGTPQGPVQDERQATRGDSTYLTYQLSHPLHTIEATSRDILCEVTVDEANRSVKGATFSAEVMTFDSGNSNRDSHALEVLDALDYPTVSFRTTTVVTRQDSLTVAGELTFHGRTLPVIFPAMQRWNGNTLMVTGNARVSLTAFGIDRPSLLLIPVSDTLMIRFSAMFPGSGS